MSDRKRLDERRMDKRFNVRNGAIAIIKNGISRAGQIKNISKKGLAFQYLNDECTDSESFELAIIFADSGFYLDKIPFDTVSNFEIESKFPLNYVFLKQRCVRFGELSPEQLTQVNRFIQNYTNSRA